MRAMRFLCCASLVFSGQSGIAAGKTPGEVEVGQILRDVNMRSLNGADRKLSQYRGRPLLINVWASWCGPCRLEMGSLERLAWGDESNKFTVIGISTDDSETAAKAFLKWSNATLSHYIDRALELEYMLGANRLPLTVLVDAHGKVLGKYYGARQWDQPEARNWIDSMLRTGR